MNRRHASKRRDKQGFALRDAIEDLTLKPKHLPSRLPETWVEDEDGDLQPVYGIEYAYIYKDLEPYNRFPRLHQERVHIRKRIGPPFPFLGLPAELRVHVYRYCLISFEPIDCENTLRSDSQRKLGVGLLRLNKQVHAEAAQVLYRENTFRFWREYDFLKVMQLLPKHSFNWLKQLTIGAPFMGFALYLDEDELSDLGDGFDPPGTILGYKYNAEDFIQHRLVYGLVDVIATAPNLRTLNIVVPPDWNYHQCCTFYFDGDNDDDNNHVHIDNIGIWDAMAALLRLKPFLLVTVIDVYRPNNLDRHLLRHERFINQLKRRLGIWDIREAECRLDRDTIPDGMSTRNRGEWAMPTQSSREHPDEYLRYLAELFSGKL